VPAGKTTKEKLSDCVENYQRNVSDLADSLVEADGNHAKTSIKSVADLILGAC